MSKAEEIHYKAVIAADNQEPPKDYCISAYADHFNGFIEGFIEGYHQAEKDILSEYGWLVSKIKVLKLKYCHNREAVEAVEDVCGKLYKFKTDIEHG